MKYPTLVNRRLSVPEWAKAPFVPRGPEPALIFTMAAAKTIARHEWKLHKEGDETSEEDIKEFVFRFAWRWRGDDTNRYEVLARWTYEFISIAHKEKALMLARELKRTTDWQKTHLDIVMIDDKGGEEAWDLDYQLPPALKHDLTRSGRIKRFIVLNPKLPKPSRSPAKAKR